MLSHWVLLGVQGLPELLPEQVWVCVCAGPAQVGLSLQEPPHAVVRRKLLHGNVLQEHQDQHVLLLVKQTEAGEWKQGEWLNLSGLTFRGRLGWAHAPMKTSLCPWAPTLKPTLHQPYLASTWLYWSILAYHTQVFLLIIWTLMELRAVAGSMFPLLNWTASVIE